ncbi:MAG: hypothetical protein ABIK08_04115 [Pseudomonadota bacterium]
MKKLEHRLAALESALAGRCREDPQEAAMGRLLAALREALPDDESEYITTGFARRVVYSSTHQWHMDKVRALVDRIEAGEVSEEDRSVLDGLPHDALECVDMTAPELVAMIAGIEFFY